MIIFRVFLRGEAPTAAIAGALMMPLAEEQGINSFGSEEVQAMQDLDLRVCPRFSVIFWRENVGEWDDHVGYSRIILGGFFMGLFGCFWKNPLRFKLTHPTKVWFSIGSMTRSGRLKEYLILGGWDKTIQN